MDSVSASSFVAVAADEAWLGETDMHHERTLPGNQMQAGNPRPSAPTSSNLDSLLCQPMALKSKEPQQ